MHFWIDKRSQTCGFSGRHRIPSSLSTGASRSRSRSRCVGRGGIAPQAKPMVTPVHRFQSIESVAAAGAPGSARQLRHAHRLSQSRHQHQYSSVTPSSISHHHSHNQNGTTPMRGGGAASVQQQQQQHTVDLVDGSALMDQPHLSRTTGPSVSVPINTAAGDAAANNAQVVPPSKLKCSTWVSFALITVFIGGTKFYFNNQVLVFAAVMIIALLAGCYVAICRTDAYWEMLEAVVAPPHLPDAPPGPETSTRTVPTTHVFPNDPSTTDHEVTEVDLMIASVLNIQQQRQQQSLSHIIPNSSVGPPPPPYHIAVLLPQQPPPLTSDSAPPIIDDSPPPSYDKAVR